MTTKNDCELLIIQYKYNRDISKLDPVIKFAVENNDICLLEKYTKIYTKHHNYDYEVFEDALDNNGDDMEYSESDESLFENSNTQLDVKKSFHVVNEINYLNNIADVLSEKTSLEVLICSIAFAEAYSNIDCSDITKFLDKLSSIKFSKEIMYDVNFRHHIFQLFAPVSVGNSYQAKYLKRFLQNNIENITFKFAKDLLERLADFRKDLDYSEKNFDLIQCYQILLNVIVRKFHDRITNQ